jgi:hypothetical protein
MPKNKVEPSWGATYTKPECRATKTGFVFKKDAQAWQQTRLQAQGGHIGPPRRWVDALGRRLVAGVARSSRSRQASRATRTLAAPGYVCCSFHVAP